MLITENKIVRDTPHDIAMDPKTFQTGIYGKKEEPSPRQKNSVSVASSGPDWKKITFSDHQFFHPVCKVRGFKASCTMLSFWQLNINTYKLHRCLTKQNMLFVCIFRIILFSSVQFSRSVMSDFAIQWTATCQASRSITNSQSLLKLMSIKSVTPSNHLTLCHALLLLPSLSQHQGLFKRASFSYQVAEVLEFQLQHQSFQWIFRTDFL